VLLTHISYIVGVRPSPSTSVIQFQNEKLLNGALFFVPDVAAAPLCNCRTGLGTILQGLSLTRRTRQIGARNVYDYHLSA
jgi:hypothetical protein